MAKKLLRIVVVALIMLGVFGVTSCKREGLREQVISYVNKLNEAREIVFVVEDNTEYIQTSVQKYDDDGKLAYMHNKTVHRETGEVLEERLYQNGKDFDLFYKTYYDVVLQRNSSIGPIIPYGGFLQLKSTTFEKTSNKEYFVTVYPQTVLGDLLGDKVFEYTIKIENNFISEIHFAGTKATISQDIGQQIIIDETEFTRKA